MLESIVKYSKTIIIIIVVVNKYKIKVRILFTSIVYIGFIFELLIFYDHSKNYIDLYYWKVINRRYFVKSFYLFFLFSFFARLFLRHLNVRKPNQAYKCCTKFYRRKCNIYNTIVYTGANYIIIIYCTEPIGPCVIYRRSTF